MVKETSVGASTCEPSIVEERLMESRDLPTKQSLPISMRFSDGRSTHHISIPLLLVSFSDPSANDVPSSSVKPIFSDCRPDKSIPHSILIRPLVSSIDLNCGKDPRPTVSSQSAWQPSNTQAFASRRLKE